MLIDLSEAVEFLKGCEDAVILTHQSPDGDCIGAGFALKDLLEALGKRSRVLCSDEFPKRYDFMTSVGSGEEFEPKTVIAVDIADPQLMGNLRETYGNKVQLCIDHHISNVGYAEKTLLNAGASATCELIYELADAMKIQMSDHCAACIYTGIATDTGCFKYECTTARCHEIAAELMKSHKLKYAKINREMFDVKSIGRLKMERIVTDLMEYYLDNRLTMICITSDILNEQHVDANDLDGCASIPLQVEGVEVGVTIKEKSENEYKVSMRSANDVNVSAICQTLGGGGHIKAAGCLVKGTLEEVKAAVVEAVRKGMEE
ncbi:MAG: bifunctional oligoribonuclease/PAP phosphatase NrnA [Ruminococcus sp.]|nr:bifunctional oligoribonuclease/PAP phosphatase NrnA [Ruminococcus sp.]MDD6634863.1 bifunctional oligoribonuclease/PAP phosphatase NrnA [Ruminococcus sp.]MDY3214188.1 bifunctional oligoribonuclease/PAP phosphatase NrnA [Ruminococcus sp.]HOF68041.1 bifunctional oligoribonuclease/PAP phosphatase NrnA [Ruminococcus sp.]